MRVALITSEYPPGRTGGIGTSTQNLARGLVATGHVVDVHVVGIGDDYDDEGAHVRHHAFSFPRRLGWFEVRRRLRELLHRATGDEEPHIIEAPDWGGLTAGMRLHSPLVVRCHGSATYFASLLDERVRPSVRLAEAVALHGADAVAAVSRFTSERTKSAFHLRRTPEVIYNCVDVARVVPKPLVDDLVILYLGSVTRKKGILDLCVAFNEVARRLPTAELWVVGRDTADKANGGTSTWEQGWAKIEAHARSRVHYVGPVESQEVGSYLSAARVCAFPSYAEAGPLSWMEAMANGRVVVGYDHAWAREVVTPDSSGVLVHPARPDQLADALVDLLPDHERILRIAHVARSQAESRFSIGVGVQETVRWYERVLEKRMATSQTRKASR